MEVIQIKNKNPKYNFVCQIKRFQYVQSRHHWHTSIKQYIKASAVFSFTKYKYKYKYTDFVCTKYKNVQGNRVKA